MDLRLLKTHMVAQGKTAADMAAELGISRGSWFNKTKGRSDFTVKEAIGIKKALCLTNAQISEIFFAK